MVEEDKLIFLKMLQDNGVTFTVQLYDEYFSDFPYLDYITHFGGSYLIEPELISEYIKEPKKIIGRLVYQIKDAKKLDQFINDRHQYQAKFFGVELSVYINWFEWCSIEGCQCTAKGKTGKRCNNRVYGKIPEPKNFIFGHHDVCKIHREKE